MTKTSTTGAPQWPPVFFTYKTLGELLDVDRKTVQRRVEESGLDVVDRQWGEARIYLHRIPEVFPELAHALSAQTKAIALAVDEARVRRVEAALERAEDELAWAAEGCPSLDQDHRVQTVRRGGDHHAGRHVQVSCTGDEDEEIARIDLRRRVEAALTEVDAEDQDDPDPLATYAAARIVGDAKRAVEVVARRPFRGAQGRECETPERRHA